MKEQRLVHREEGEKVRVGMEASGHARWFERLLLRLQASNGREPDGGSHPLGDHLPGGLGRLPEAALVPYIDTNFRTLARSSSRAIIGTFIGAYGALRLGLLHTDVFGTIYAMGPVGTGSGVQVFTSRPDWALLEHADSLAQVRNAGFSTLFLSMFQAFLPNTAKAPLYVDLPVEETAGNFPINAERIGQLRSRFFIAELVPQHLEQIKGLRALKIDWSRNDFIYDHVYSNQALTHLLNEYGIEHEADEFNGFGDAYWGKTSRMTKEVLPFLAEHLETGQQ